MCTRRQTLWRAMPKTYSELPTIGTNLLGFVTITQQSCILLWNFSSCAPDAKQQTGLLVQEKKKILKEIHVYLETFAVNLIWSTALSTQPPWWPKKRKVQTKRHRNFSQDFPSNFQSVTFKCKGEKEPCSVNRIYLVALIKVSETFYVRVYRGYIGLVISLGNQRVVVSHKMSLKLTKINLWDLNEIKAFFSWTESLWKFEENFNKCLSQNPT